MFRNVLPLLEVKTFATTPSTVAYSPTSPAARLAEITVAVWASTNVEQQLVKTVAIRSKRKGIFMQNERPTEGFPPSLIVTIVENHVGCRAWCGVASLAHAICRSFADF